MNKIFFKLEDLPTDKRDPEFWADISKDNLKYLYVYNIMNDLRKIDIEKMTGKQCRVKLASLKQLQNLIDIYPTIEDHRVDQPPVIKQKTAEQYFETI